MTGTAVPLVPASATDTIPKNGPRDRDTTDSADTVADRQATKLATSRRPVVYTPRRKPAAETPQMKRCRAYWSKRYAQMVGQ